MIKTVLNHDYKKISMIALILKTENEKKSGNQENQEKSRFKTMNEIMNELNEVLVA